MIRCIAPPHSFLCLPSPASNLASRPGISRGSVQAAVFSATTQNKRKRVKIIAYLVIHAHKHTCQFIFRWPDDWQTLGSIFVRSSVPDESEKKTEPAAADDATAGEKRSRSPLGPPPKPDRPRSPEAPHPSSNHTAHHDDPNCVVFVGGLKTFVPPFRIKEVFSAAGMMISVYGDRCPDSLNRGCDKCEGSARQGFLLRDLPH